MQHADALWIMKNVREIIKAIRNTFNINKVPPVCGNASGIQVPKYAPYDLIDKTPRKLFQDKKYYNVMKHVVRTHYKLKATRDKKLISALIKDKYKYVNILSMQQIREELTFCVQHSPNEFQLVWSSIFEVDIDDWYQINHLEYIYLTHDDKQNESEIPEKIDIPYFKNGISQYIQLLSFLRLQFCDYPAVISPFSSCISLASYFDSIFVYVFLYVYLYLFAIIYIYSCLLLSRSHQDTEQAVFAHHQQKSFSGAFINGKSGIPKGFKQYKLRNCFFKLHYIIPIYSAMFMVTLTQSGGAINERIHANIHKKWSWLPTQLIGYDRAPAMDQLVTHSINYDAAQRIVEDVLINSEKYSEFEIQQSDEILSVYDASTGIDDIRSKKLNEKTKHGHLNFDIDKSLKKYWKSYVFCSLYVFICNYL